MQNKADPFELDTAFQTPPTSLADAEPEKKGEGRMAIKIKEGDDIEIGRGVSIMVGKRQGKLFLSVSAPGQPIKMVRDGKTRIGGNDDQGE